MLIYSLYPVNCARASYINFQTINLLKVNIGNFEETSIHSWILEKIPHTHTHTHERLKKVCACIRVVCVCVVLTMDGREHTKRTNQKHRRTTEK